MMNTPHHGTPFNLYHLRFAECHPNADHISEVACVILAETWLNRVRSTMPNGRSRNMEDWTRNNAEIMDAFERSVSVDAPDFALFEGLQYPCERCAATTTLRDAYLVSVDEDGLPNHDGYPEYLCADCGRQAVDEDADS